MRSYLVSYSHAADSLGVSQLISTPFLAFSASTFGFDIEHTQTGAVVTMGMVVHHEALLPSSITSEFSVTVAKLFCELSRLRTLLYLRHPQFSILTFNWDKVPGND